MGGVPIRRVPNGTVPVTGESQRHERAGYGTAPRRNQGAGDESLFAGRMGAVRELALGVVKRRVLELNAVSESFEAVDETALDTCTVMFVGVGAAEIAVEVGP